MSISQNAFWDNATYNAALAASRCKPRTHIERRNPCVKTDEVLNRVAEKGFKLSSKTLGRYQKAGLVPGSNIVSMGRGGGKYADWPEVTPAHLFAAYRLINGHMIKPFVRQFFKVTSDGVVEARQAALDAVKTNSERVDFISCKWLDFVAEFYEGLEKVPPEVLYIRQLREKWNRDSKSWEEDMLSKYGELPW